MKIGGDIIEIERIAQAISNSERFRSRVFTASELAYCCSRGKQADASLAGIFAAKEAFIKALGIGMRYGSWQDIEIGHDELGAPTITCTGRFRQIFDEKGYTFMEVSISHARRYATAQVLIG